MITWVNLSRNRIKWESQNGGCNAKVQMNIFNNFLLMIELLSIVLYHRKKKKLNIIILIIEKKRPG